ncbi:uroporphyrinogen-III C-methyltransferase [Sphingomonas sp.]|uniref:uroporphyrinogen-III C-methyltransferase n=1 Tax=Sphingomonas sp. TaxID=28214 RepID=UPI0025DE7277|nr:uroporphyrinogen-III C-methyltransferase [Sphingomonas sp.]
MRADDFPPGSVWLVGAGPGDPDLLTRKAEALLRCASIVFHDALVGPGVLALIPDHVRRVPVGKRSGRHSRRQEAINHLLIEAAVEGERVVRLKGGDPALFARSAEEMAALSAEGIAVRICPGITAASAAAASAGLSLSLRGKARRVEFVTAHAAPGRPLDLDWTRLADPQATIAFYMGRTAAADISRNLIAAGLAAATPVIVACDISLPEETRLQTRLDLLPFAVAAIAEDRPTLIIVGEAVAPPGMVMAQAAATKAADAQG